MMSELEKVFQATKAEGEGSWKPRPRLTARWRGHKRLLGQIDAVIARVWEAQKVCTLWDLNCLLYAGAAVAES